MSKLAVVFCADFLFVITYVVLLINFQSHIRLFVLVGFPLILCLNYVLLRSSNARRRN